MTTLVRGPIRLVTDRPDTVRKINLRAPELRLHGAGIVTDHNDDIPVVGGQVEFEALPGPAVLTLVTAGGAPLRSVDIVVPDEDTATLSECLDQIYVYDPPVVGRAQQFAREAGEHAARAEAGADRVGSAEQVGAWVGEAEVLRDDTAEAAEHAETQAGIATEQAGVAAGHAEQAGEDRVQTGADRRQTGEDRVQTGEDREAAEGWASQSKDAATLAITSAASLERHVADRDPTDDDTAYPGAVWVSPDQVWIRGEGTWHPISANEIDKNYVDAQDQALGQRVDSLIRRSDNPYDYSWVVSDDDGNVPLAVRDDGSVDFRRLTPETVDYLTSLAPETSPPEPSSIQWVTDTTLGGLHATHVSTGRRIRLSEEAKPAEISGDTVMWFEGAELMYQKSPDDGPWRATDRTRISAWGSSSIGESHAQLQAMAGSLGIPDTHLGGVGSDRARHILGRMGAVPFALAEDATLPASGEAALTLTTGAPSTAAFSLPVPGTLGGVHGMFYSRTRYIFVRDEPGTEVIIPAGTEFIPDAVTYRDAPSVLQIGKNDISSEGATGEQVLEWTEQAFTWLRTLPKWTIVLGHHLNSEWTPATPAAVETAKANRMCAEKYKERFVDLNAYLCSPDVWDHTGITPTQADLDKQADGIMPLSLARDYGPHMNEAARVAYVENLLIPHLTELGWY